jgi:hypothetical protein
MPGVVSLIDASVHECEYYAKALIIGTGGPFDLAD